MSLVLKTPEQAGYPPCIPCITILPPPIPGREGAARYPPCITVLSPPNTWAGGRGCDPEATACCSTLRALSTTGMAAAAIGLMGAATGACGFSCWLLLSPA